MYLKSFLLTSPLISSFLSTVSTSPGNLLFSVETLCEAFPFHFVFKRNFRIIEMGNSLKRYVRVEGSLIKKSNKIMFSDLFIISRPIIELTFEAILTFSNHLFLIFNREEYVGREKGLVKGGKGGLAGGNEDARSVRMYTLSPERVTRRPHLRLKGQMISLPAFDAILFVGSPKIEEMEEMLLLDLTISDFPVHDATGRHLMTRAIRSDDQEVINKIDKAANHLKIVEKKLRSVCVEEEC